MAIVFVEGFDIYNGFDAATTTSVGLRSRWIGGGGSMVAGRFGGQAARPGDINSPINANMPSTYTSGCFGFAINLTAGNSSGLYGHVGVSTQAITAAFTNAPPQFYININTSFQIQVYRGAGVGVLLATSTATLTQSAWNYIEVEFVISATVGEVRVYLNNNPTPVINISGVNNKGQTGSGFSCVTLAATTGSGATYDDLYVTDTPNRLGEQRVVTSYPNSDVLTTYWSSSTSGAAPYTMIDETTCDGDTTYVSSNTTNSRIVTGVSSLPVPPVDVSAVQLTGFARKDETQLRQLALEYQNTVGSVATGPTNTLTPSYNYVNALYPQNPLTGTAWTGTDVNNMRIGARVVT